MAKKQIPITKEILENIIKQNPNANYSQLVKILNKGGYVTQAAQGYDKDIDQIKTIEPMQKVLENRCQSCKKSDNFLEKYTSRAISPIYRPDQTRPD